MTCLPLVSITGDASFYKLRNVIIWYAQIFKCMVNINTHTYIHIKKEEVREAREDRREKGGGTNSVWS